MGPRPILVPSLLLGVATLGAQEEPRRLPTTESALVVVDAVARDGKGRPVTDLTAADFEVLEDGVVQDLGRFVPPSPEPARPNPAAASNAPEAPAGEGQPAIGVAEGRARDVVAFVFDQLSTEGRVASQRAARSALGERGPDDVFGVFSVEGSLVVLQDFTTDPALLQVAFDAVGTRAAHAGSTQLDQAKEATGRRLATNAARATLIGMPDPGSNEEGAARAQAQILAMRLGLAQAAADAFERLERDAHGQTTANALTAIVDALRALPGRKAVVLFSEGLFRTEANEARFLSVIHSANRALVSVYPVEASGLQTTSYESLTREAVVSAAQTSASRQASGRDTGGGAFTREIESGADSVRFHPRASLEWIADRTGGVFVKDTNDLEGALRRISSDLRSYYLLGYRPRNPAFDGRFRKIDVRVRRKGVDVRSRAGYFAVRSEEPVLTNVAPALALLEAGRRPHDVEVHAGAWPFPSGESSARVTVAVRLDGASRARLAAAAKGNRLDITLLARFVAADGRPVDALSRRFVLDPRGSAEGGDVFLLRDAWLPPGRYTLEAVAYEAGEGRAGVAVHELEVQDGYPPLARAQLVMVRGTLPIADASADFETAHPLRFGDVVLQPLAEATRSRRAPLPLVFQVAFAGPLPGPEAMVEIWRGEERLDRSRVNWAPPDASGLLRSVAEVPLRTLDIGLYELRVRLSKGASEQVLRAPFQVVD